MKIDNWERFDWFGWGMAVGITLVIAITSLILALT